MSAARTCETARLRVRLLRSGVLWILVAEICFALMRMAMRWGAADLPGLEIGGVRSLGRARFAAPDRAPGVKSTRPLC